MKNKNINILILVINVLVVISTFIIVVQGLTQGLGEGQLGELSGVNYFKAFTVDSNILSAVTCFVVLVFNIDNLIQNKYEIPYWVIRIHYIGTVAVTLTLCTVLVFLSPMQVLMGNSYFRLFSGSMFFLHFLNPLFAIIECLILKSDYKFSLKDNLYACIPMIIYCIVYTTMVLSNKWTDFYNFTLGGNLAIVPFAIVIMVAFTFLLGFIIKFIHNKIINNEKVSL